MNPDEKPKVIASPRSTQLENFIRHSLIAYGPLILPLGAVLWGLALNALIFLSQGEPLTGLQCVAAMLGIIVAALCLLAVSYRLCRRYKSQAMRFCVVYLFWLIALFGTLFLINFAIGGTSMATADGGLTREQLFAASWRETVRLWGWAQLFVIPWALLAVRWGRSVNYAESRVD